MRRQPLRHLRGKEDFEQGHTFTLRVLFGVDREPAGVSHRPQKNLQEQKLTSQSFVNSRKA